MLSGREEQEGKFITNKRTTKMSLLHIQGTMILRSLGELKMKRSNEENK